MEKLEVVTKKQGERPITTVRIQGDLDLQGSDKLLAKLMEMEDYGCFNILVDLGKVEFVCSSGLGVLIATLENLKKHKGTLKLLRPQERVTEKFKITKLIREFEIYENEEEALRSFDLRQ